MSISILLVEDDQPTAALFQVAIQEIGLDADLHHFTYADDALNFLRGNHVDLAVVDMSLPGNLDVLLEARGCRRVVFTASARPEDRQFAELIGAGFMRKPIGLDAFIAAVEQICCATSVA